MSAGRPAVLVVSQLPPPVHGSTVMTLHLVRTLRASGWDVAVVQRRFSSSAAAVGRPSVGKVLAIPALALRLVRGVRTARPRTCIFFLTNRPGSFLVDALLLEILRLLRVPVVHYVHTVGFRALAARGPLWRALVGRAVRAGRGVTLGRSLIDDVQPFEPPAVEIVPNTTRPPARRSRPLVDGPVHAVYLSNLDPEKGADAFVRCAAILAREPGWRFTIAGAGDADRLDAIRTAAARSGASIDVRGAVDTAEKWLLLAEADVLVFPSTYRYEAQPLTIVEAMALGIPVLAYDVGGVRDLVMDDVTGLLVPPGDERALLAGARLMADRDRRARLGDAAEAHFAERLSPDAYRTAWQELLR